MASALYGPKNNVIFSLVARLTFYTACTTNSHLISHIYLATTLIAFPKIMF
jgi:hypothetical protein